MPIVISNRVPRRLNGERLFRNIAVQCIAVRVWQRVLQLASLPSNKEDKSEEEKREQEVQSYLPHISYAPFQGRCFVRGVLSVVALGVVLLVSSHG
jgi:hypothetical protein